MPKEVPPDLARLHVRLGTNEIEVEGREEVVAAHFKTWQQLILSRDNIQRNGEPAPMPGSTPPSAPPAEQRKPFDLFRVDAARRIVALRLYPGGDLRHPDAALLLLHGFCLAFGGAAPVLVTRLKAALAASGHRAARIDRILAPHLASRLVRKAGRRIGSTYELTAAGTERAEALVRHLLPNLHPEDRTPTSATGQ